MSLYDTKKVIFTENIFQFHAEMDEDVTSHGKWNCYNSKILCGSFCFESVTQHIEIENHT